MPPKQPVKPTFSERDKVATVIVLLFLALIGGIALGYWIKDNEVYERLLITETGIIEVMWSDESHTHITFKDKLHIWTIQNPDAIEKLFPNDEIEYDYVEDRWRTIVRYKIIGRGI